MSTPRVVIVDNYDSFTYNLVQLVGELTGRRPRVVRHDVAIEQVGLAWASHIILSPGPGRPDRVGDFGVCSDVIRLARVPVLGVCLGHQGIALASGGRVCEAPRVVHGYRSVLEHDGTGLFDGVRDQIAVVRYHSLAVAEPLPSDLRVTARAEDGVVMALEHASRPLFGIQFHPESVLSEAGPAIVENFLRVPSAAVDIGQSHTDSGTEVRRAEPVRPAPVLHTRRLAVATSAQDCFDRLCGDGLSFWLDSSSLDKPSAQASAPRFSYLGLGDRELVVEPDDAIAALDEIDRELNVAPEAAPGLPFSFMGGYVGGLGYQLGAPRLHLMHVSRFVVIDHLEDATYVCELGGDGQWIDTAEALLSSPGIGPERRDLELAAEGFQPGLERDDYLEAVSKCLEAIRSGESYELCLTDQLRLDGDYLPCARQLYRRLRCHNPAPYAAFLSLSDRAVLSSSPELFLSLDRDGVATSKPIKGTTPRHENAERDAAARDQLASSAKDRAENLMIADLVRNDLGRVARLGKVRCDPLMDVESFATVHQLVTTVSAELMPECRFGDLVEATFPPGSMTGAPKRRATELLASLEAGPRGLYAGAIGYLSYGRTLELSVAIRTAVVHSDHISVGAGGAIIHGSDPDAEYSEMRHKAAAVIDALSRPDDGDCSAKAAAEHLESRPHGGTPQWLDAGLE